MHSIHFLVSWVMTLNPRLRIFMLAIPLVILFGAGVLFRSTKAITIEAYGCVADNLSGIPESDFSAIFEGRDIVSPRVALAESNTQVLGVANPSERWIEVDLSDQLLRAWDGGQMFLETKVSTGLPGTPTPKGEFRVWVKLRATKMEGGEGRYYYYLPNVPFVMYFENKDIPGWKGYGIHGTYWHNDFGTPRSHGCVNVPTQTAEKLYYWATPQLPENKASVFASAENPGIRIIVHD
jgi:hypothetical protein